MKKVLLLVIILFAFSGENFAQANLKHAGWVYNIPTNVQRFLFDYEIAGWKGAIKDTFSVQSLDLNYYDSKRKVNSDTSYFDVGTNLTIIVYSEKKVQTKKPTH